MSHIAVIQRHERATQSCSHLEQLAPTARTLNSVINWRRVINAHFNLVLHTYAKCMQSVLQPNSCIFVECREQATHRLSLMRPVVPLVSLNTAFISVES